MKRAVVYFGSDMFSVETLKSLLRHGEDVMRHLHVVTSRHDTSLCVTARQQGVSVTLWPDVPRDADVGIVASFGHLIPRDVIMMFPGGLINVHPSVLPRWRGPAPIQRAILAGDRTTGVTLMLIAPDRFDHGDIIAREVVTVGERPWRLRDLRQRLATVGGHLAARYLRGDVTLDDAAPQTDDGATYAAKITARTRRIRFDTHTCRDICRLEAAVEPQPLLCAHNNTEVRLSALQHRGHVTEGLLRAMVSCSHTATPGDIHVKHDLLFLRLVDGWLPFGSVQLKGKKLMTPRMFYNGYIGPRKTLPVRHRFHDLDLDGTASGKHGRNAL